ncbi:glycosyltransferase [Brevibacillus dissolubilis]|uniref:glycosyltransferase n=1 Tax=Brevibacillus dissolubilis TaxID=1844116 RepID=UPI0011172B11|nr:glycosyltransferase [Brevibacillus dissolubilis]
MKHIVHIVEATGGGVLKYLLQLTKDAGGSDLSHTILYSHRDVTPDNLSELFAPHVRLVHFPMVRQISPAKDWDTIRQLYRYLRELQPDVIHLHSSKAGFLGRLAAWLLRKPKVYYTPHGYSFLMNSEGFLKRAVYFAAELVLSQVRGGIIACSKSEHRFARMLNPFGENILLENALDLHVPQHQERSPLRIVAVGRLDEQKNPLLFIRIIARLRQFLPEIEAVWIGDGPLRSACEQLDRETGANITFTGWLPHPEVLTHVATAGLFLQTSRWEGLPFSILEAFALGAPIIASDITAHRDLITGQNGLLAHDENDFVQHALTVLRQPEVAQALSQGALKSHQTTYSYDTFIQTIQTIYNN